MLSIEQRLSVAINFAFKLKQHVAATFEREGLVATG